MCIVFLDYQPDGSKPYLLILANNRDEFYNRSTAELSYWSDYPNILAGRDIENGPNGGTWIGVNKQGRFSVLTNWRKPVDQPPMRGAKSRGHLVSEYLQGSGSNSSDYCASIMKNPSNYEKFNLLVGDLGLNKCHRQLTYCTNVSETVRSIGKGVYTISNEELDSPWTKQVEGRKIFESIISEADSITKECLTDRLIGLLCDSTSYHPDPKVRDTGHSEGWMRGFNRVFVSTPEGSYGTRTNSVILIDHNGQVTYTERTRIQSVEQTLDTHWTKNTISFNIQQ